MCYKCINNVNVLKFCQDGLMFDNSTTIKALCDYPFHVECGKFHREIRKMAVADGIDADGECPIFGRVRAGLEPHS